MTTSQDIGRELRARRRARAIQPRPPGWDWGPRRPPGARKAWLVLGLVVAVAVIVASLPPAGAGPSLKGVGTMPTTTTTTTTTVPPPVLEPQALAPPVPEPAPVEAMAGPHPLVFGGEVPAWAWAGPSRLNAYGLAAIAMAAGCAPWQAVFATAIAFGESNGRTDAVGDVALQNGTWGPSLGPWQVRSVWAENHTGGVRDGHALLTNVWHNAASMVAISSGCNDWRPWTVARLGRHLEHLPAAIDGVLAVRGVQ